MKTTILLVEDDPMEGEYFKTSLEAGGYDVVWVRTGKDAVEGIRVTKPDMIVMDVGLGLDEVDGVEIVRTLRENGNDSAVVYLTAYWSADHVQRAMETNPCGYIAKPTTGETVLAEVKKAFTRVFAMTTAKAQGHLEGVSSESVAEDIRKLQSLLSQCVPILDKLVERTSKDGKNAV